MAKEKFLADYKKLVMDTKEKYLKEKLDHGWNYTLKEEQLENDWYFMICNHHYATKIVYNHEYKFIVHKDIIMNDAKLLMEMKEQLWWFETQNPIRKKTRKSKRK